MSIPPEQHEVARFLKELAGSEPVETHISAVFVGSDMAWKLKKAVRLPFLDFTTIEARHHFLRRELELNQPSAPAIYRDIAAVVREGDGALTLMADPGARSPLDWVLRMAPLAKADFLDAVAARGGLTLALLDALGDSVAQYHARLPPVAGWDSPGTLLRIAEGSRASALAAGLPRAAIERWFEQAASALRACAASLAARAAAGFVRRGHGDLHLGNLCLWDGKPTPFDALEFDEALATADLGYDLAFLLMDLDRRVGREAANRVLNRYVARTGDAALTCGLPAFLSLRAMIRAHVQAEAGRPTEGAAYLDAALAYLHRKPALLLAIGGLQGIGKSTQARMLAPGIGDAPGALVLRSDEIRKRLFGVAPEQRLPETAYAEAVNEAVNRELVRLAQAVAACGHAVVADASFLDPGLRAAIAAAANAARVPFIGVWLHAPLDVLEERLAARTHDASDATADVLRRAAACDPGPINWLPVEASDAIRAASSIRRELLGGIAGRSCPQDW